MINKYTAQDFCCEDIKLIENYDKAVNDSTQTWHCHHRLELNDGYIITAEELTALGLYYSRPASELIFLTPFEHHSMHGLNMSKITKIKRSKSLSGSGNGNFGKHFSKEHREKLSNSHIGKKPWNYGKEMNSDKMKWYNNGIINVRCESAPEGFVPGRIDYDVDKNKLSKATKNTKWYNNSIKNIRAKECPPGFVEGRLYFKNKRNSGMKWYNNGIRNIQARECPEGFTSGRIKKN